MATGAVFANYCWDWKSKSDSKARDVVIPEHRFGTQWNLTDDGSLWIVAPESVHQIGCIHTCQGLEVDWIGLGESRPHHQEHLSDAHDARDEGLLRVLHGS